jgi:hypothetical protein
MVVASWPIITYGSSTGHDPIHVRINHELDMHQNRIWVVGLNLDPTLFLKKVNGGSIKIIRAIAKATAPPSLFGTDRRIA